MAKYVCDLCGYVYDEDIAYVEANIIPGTPWKDIPDSFICPLCGASKNDFNLQIFKDKKEVNKKHTNIDGDHDMRELNALESSALCSNLAKGCEKQYKGREAELFYELADYFKSKAPEVEEEASIENLINLINRDLEEGFIDANEISAAKGDRGALRALVWSQKVSRILKSLLTRYQSKGDDMLNNTGVYLCTICGFIYVGDRLPELCPINVNIEMHDNVRIRMYKFANFDFHRS